VSKRRQRKNPRGSEKSSDQLALNLSTHSGPNEASTQSKQGKRVGAKVYRMDEVHKKRERTEEGKYIRAIVDLVRDYK